MSAVYLQQFPSYSNHNCKKSSFLRTQAFIFCFPWGRPCGNHAKHCMNEKTIQCLPNPSQHVPICLQQFFFSYSNRKCKKSPFSRTAAHVFVSPGDAPAIITQYVAWMERQFNACQTPQPICLLQKLAVFTYHSPHFCFPWRRPCDYHPICSVTGKTIQCVPNPCSMYLSIFNSFLVQKTLFLPHFCFPWGCPSGIHAKCCMDEKRIRCLHIVSLHVLI